MSFRFVSFRFVSFRFTFRPKGRSRREIIFGGIRKWFICMPLPPPKKKTKANFSREMESLAALASCRVTLTITGTNQGQWPFPHPQKRRNDSSPRVAAAGSHPISVARHRGMSCNIPEPIPARALGLATTTLAYPAVRYLDWLGHQFLFLGYSFLPSFQFPVARPMESRLIDAGQC